MHEANADYRCQLQPLRWSNCISVMSKTSFYEKFSVPKISYTYDKLLTTARHKF